MDGLQKILSKIEDEGNIKYRAVKEEALKKAAEIKKEKAAAAEKEAAEILEAAEKHASLIAENAKGSCEAVIRRGELSVKTELVEEKIRAAMGELENLGKDEYFGLLLGLIKSHIHPGERGELILSEKDAQRLPDGFVDKINEENGADIVLSDKRADISAGCILKYGGIDENCSFEALLEEKSAAVKDRFFAALR